MLRMPSIREPRNCLLHLRTLLGWKRIQKKVKRTETECTAFPAIGDKERALSWCSTRQNRRTERVPKSLECVEEMLQEIWLSRWTFYRYSRSISQRSSLSWITTRNRMDTRKVQRDGRTCKTKPHAPSLCRGISKIPRTLVSQLERVRQKWAHATSTGLSSCSLSKTVSTASQVSKLQNQFPRNNTRDGIFPQAIHGGTRQNGVGELMRNFYMTFCGTVGIVYSWHRSAVTDGGCRQIHLTRHFSHAVHTPWLMCLTLHWLKCLYARVTPYSCHPWWAFDRQFLVASSFCLSLSSTSSLPTSTCNLTCTLSSMWTAPKETPAAPPPNEEYCAPWRYTLLPHDDTRSVGKSNDVLCKLGY